MVSSSLKKKLVVTLEAIIVFLLISAPFTYKFTNGLFGGGLADEYSGAPTSTGLIVHSLVFGLVLLGLLALTEKLHK
jgi:hypothetical protein